MRYEDRQRAIADALADREVEALLITNLVNVRYLCGFRGSNGALLVAPGRSVLLTDFRYVTVAAHQTRGVEVVQAGRDMTEKLGQIAGEMAPGGRLGFEAADVTVARHRALDKELGDLELIATTGVVERARLVKDPDEIAVMAEASRIADLAYAAVVDGAFRGRTERQVAWELEGVMRAGGADGLSFDMIVASGERGAMPHAVPDDVCIPTDTLVTVDLGVELDGYMSDCTRTFATGTPPDELVRAYDVCLEAQILALDALRPGVTGGDLDAIARDHITAAGFGEAFGHGLGHGVGMDIHEAPGARQASEDVFEPGMTITIEPGIYLPGVGGCRIEDLCVVTPEGRDVLTGFTKDRLTVDC